MFTPSFTATVGNVLILTAAVPAGSSITINTVTDNQSNTWQQRVTGFLSGQNTRIAIFDCMSVGTAPTSITVTFSAAARACVHLIEMSGLSTYDVGSASGVATTTTPAAQTVTTTADDDFVVSGIDYPSITITATTTGWTDLGYATAATQRLKVAYLIVGAAGSYGPAWTLSTTSVTGLATVSYKVPASGAAFPYQSNPARGLIMRGRR